MCISDALRALAAFGLLGFVVPVQAAPFESDANTLALYHFDSETVDRRTPDSGPFGIDGQLDGPVLPVLSPAIPAGYGFAYNFDGIDRGLGNNSRISMGTDGRVGLRGNMNWTLDVVVSAPATLADDGYFRGIVCRAGPQGVDFALSYSSWTNPTFGPEHEIWFTTAPAGGADGQPPEYAYASANYTGLMEPGQSYAIRATVTNGVMAISVNGEPGNGGPYPTQLGTLTPGATPIGGELTIGDDCPEDSVTKPGELQIDEVRISNVSRTDDLATSLEGIVPDLQVPGASAPAPLIFRR